jgi:phosphoglucomutase
LAPRGIEARRFTRSFAERHLLAITRAICRYRAGQQIDGPLYLGRDTHALSEPARVTALEVLAANAVEVMLDVHDGATPTRVVSGRPGHNRSAARAAPTAS